VKRGDLVVAHYDEDRGIECIGLVLEVRRAEVRKYSNTKRQIDAKIMWSSKSSPIGWWPEGHLRVVSESRR